MRIVGGAFRGRRLSTPSNNIIRPTADRVRETLFNMLVHRMEISGCRVLDLFCGTGALGLEALSRGGEYCVFIDKSREGYVATSENIAKLEVEKSSHLVRGDAAFPDKLLLEATAFDLVFMDPPYGKCLAEKAARSLLEGKLLSDNAWVVVEEHMKTFPDRLEGFERTDQRAIGDTIVGFFRPN